MAPPPPHHHHHHHNHHQQQQHHGGSRNHHALPPLQTERDSKHEGGSSFPSRWSRENHRRDEGPRNNEASSSQAPPLPSYSSYASMAVGPAPAYLPKTNAPGSSNNSTSSTTPHMTRNPAAGGNNTITTTTNNSNIGRRSGSEDTFRSEKSTSLQNLAPLSTNRYGPSSSTSLQQQHAPATSSAPYRPSNPPYGGPKEDEPNDRWDRTTRNPSRGGASVGHYGASRRSDSDLPTKSSIQSSSSWRGGRGSAPHFHSASSLSRRPMDHSESDTPITPAATTQLPPSRVSSQRSSSPSQRFSSGGRERGSGGGGRGYHNPRLTVSSSNYTTSAANDNNNHRSTSGDFPPHRDDHRRSSTTDEPFASFNSGKSSSSWNRYHQDGGKDSGTSQYAPAAPTRTTDSGTFRRSTSNDYRRATSNSPPTIRGGPAHGGPPARGGGGRGMLRDEAPLVDRYPSSDLTRDNNTSSIAIAGSESRRWSSLDTDISNSKGFFHSRTSVPPSGAIDVPDTRTGSYGADRHDGASVSSKWEGRPSTFQNPCGGSPPTNNKFRPSDNDTGASSGWNQERTIRTTASSDSKEGGLVIEEGEERTPPASTTTPRYINQFRPENRSSTDAFPPHEEKVKLPSNQFYPNSDNRNSFNDANSQSRPPFARSQWNRTTSGSHRAPTLDEPGTAAHYESTTATRSPAHADDARQVKTDDSSSKYDDYGRLRHDNRGIDKPFSHYGNRESNNPGGGDETTSSVGDRRGGWSGTSTSRSHYQGHDEAGDRTTTTATSGINKRTYRGSEGLYDGSYNDAAADDWRRSTSPPFRNSSKTYDDDNKGVANRGGRGGRGGPPFPRRQPFGGRGISSRSSDPEQDRGTSGGLRWEPPPSTSAYSSAAADHGVENAKRKHEEASNDYSEYQGNPYNKRDRVDESAAARAWHNEKQVDDLHRYDHSFPRLSTDANRQRPHYHENSTASEQDRGSSSEVGTWNKWTTPNTWTNSSHLSTSMRNLEYSEDNSGSSHHQQFESITTTDMYSSLSRSSQSQVHDKHHHLLPGTGNARDDTSAVPPPPPPLPEQSGDVVVKVEPIDVDAEVFDEMPNVVPPSPPPSPCPPSGVFVATTRLVELQSQMEFSYAKYLKLLLEHEQLKAQYQVLETLPVGLDAIKDELEHAAVKVEPKTEEAHETMDEA